MAAVQCPLWQGRRWASVEEKEEEGVVVVVAVVLGVSICEWQVGRRQRGRG